MVEGEDVRAIRTVQPVQNTGVAYMGASENEGKRCPYCGMSVDDVMAWQSPGVR
jgi:hypothetical protein